MTQMEIRSVEIRSVNEEARTVSGLAVPYKRSVNVGGYNESFEPGAIEDVSETKLFWNHSEPIGRVVKGEDTDEGFLIEAVISKTSRGDEAYTLVKDGVINKFSVGFTPVEHRMDGDDVVRTKVNLMEVSLVPFPAYKDANLLSVRELAGTADRNSAITNEKENIMDNENKNAPESAELREAVEVLERKVAVLSERDSAGNAGSKIMHAGEMLKALARGDESAKMEVRAFTGATTVDADVTRPGWVSERLRLPLENRNFLNLFSKGVLPASGMAVDYPVVLGVSGTVTEQVNEGDDLAYMEVQIDSKSAPVKTYGGYSSLSRQAIERSDVAYLETVLEYQARQYAKATNKAVRDAFIAGTGYNTGTLATATAKGADWLSLVFNSAAAIEDNSHGSQAGFIIMNRVNYLKLVSLVDTTNRPVFDLNGDGSNTFGNLRVNGAQGSLAGLPIVVDNSLANGSIFIASADSVKVFESAGAPYRLADENIINLTKDFSLYGYLAVAITNPLGVVKVTVT